jgi:hypothetical protein
MIRVIAIAATLAASRAAIAAPERYYQEKWCQGVTEHVLHDRTRVDCLTETHAIEYDWGTKWAQSLGQSLGYAFETSKRAGIVLILEDKQDYKYWIKLNSIIEYYRLPIDTWKIEVWGE